MKKLTRRTAVITGAASGIGRATAQALAAKGCRLALVDINAPELEQTRALIADSAPEAEVRIYELDISDGEAVAALADQVIDDFGAAHILINNAGINITAPFQDHSVDDFRRTFDVNIWGVIYGCQCFLPHLRAAEEAHIVNISSLFGIVGVIGQAAYSASKFAVRGLTETLHEELRHTSVGVSVVHPGCVATNIVADGHIADPEMAQRARDYFAEQGCQPEVVAHRIVEAIENNRHRVLVTPESYIADWARRLSPTAGNRLANMAITGLMGFDISD